MAPAFLIPALSRELELELELREVPLAFGTIVFPLEIIRQVRQQRNYG